MHDDNSIRTAYVGAMRSFLRCFYTVIEFNCNIHLFLQPNLILSHLNQWFCGFFLQIIQFYHQQDLKQTGTHHLQPVIEYFDLWYVMCCRALQQLGISCNYDTPMLPNEHPATYTEIVRKIRIYLQQAKLFAKMVIYHDFPKEFQLINRNYHWTNDSSRFSLDQATRSTFIKWREGLHLWPRICSWTFEDGNRDRYDWCSTFSPSERNKGR